MRFEMGKGREVSPLHRSALRRTVTPTAGPGLGEWHPECTSHSELSNRAVARDRGGRLVPPAHLGQGSPPRSCTAAFTSALWCRGPSSLSSTSPPVRQPGSTRGPTQRPERSSREARRMASPPCARRSKGPPLTLPPHGAAVGTSPRTLPSSAVF